MSPESTSNKRRKRMKINSPFSSGSEEIISRWEKGSTHSNRHCLSMENPISWPDDKFYFSNFSSRHGTTREGVESRIDELLFVNFKCFLSDGKESKTNHKKIDNQLCFIGILRKHREFMPFSRNELEETMMKIRGIIDIIFMFISWSSRRDFTPGRRARRPNGPRVGLMAQLMPLVFEIIVLEVLIYSFAFASSDFLRMMML